MQDCFRQYPEVYGSEIESDAADDEDDMDADLATSPEAPSSSPNSASDVSSDEQTAPASSSRSSPKSRSSDDSAPPPRSAKAEENNRREMGLVPDNYQPDSKTSASSIKEREPVSESESLVPKAAHDAGDENTKVLQRK